MSNTERELEIKLWISQPERLRRWLEKNTQVAHPRTHERNLRFDRPDGSLGAASQVLRLRQDQHARLTFKGPGELQQGVYARQEIEFEVSSFEAARHFLEALGYQVQMQYEKFRTTYLLEGVMITWDEMPYGTFLELEGPDPVHIQAVCRTLGLDWEQRILASYTGLFDQLKDRLGLGFTDLTFENFQGITHPLTSLDLKPAD
jgi:adenylate cyclase class 2